ncbi:hypothetical protein E5288_WYG000121 [Bos mutus]|uniref:Uncharacterized protein n=1 Tax=Bos mutus TaxID=72004 RepID=A0A6B0RBC7_9CETA|nr:hypothetical protein [Bos mutus]
MRGLWGPAELPELSPAPWSQAGPVCEESLKVEKCTKKIKITCVLATQKKTHKPPLEPTSGRGEGEGKVAGESRLVGSPGSKPLAAVNSAAETPQQSTLLALHLPSYP